MMPEHACKFLQADKKRLKQALRRVLRAAAALEDERKGNGTIEDLNVAQRVYDNCVASAKKVLKEN